jgi:prevent-host-death family protein
LTSSKSHATIWLLISFNSQIIGGNMQIMPNTVPISDVKNRPGEVLDLIEQGPIILTTRGNGVAVMTSLNTWNAMAARLARLERLRRLDEAIMEADAGKVVAYEYANPMHA